MPSSDQETDEDEATEEDLDEEKIATPESRD
jgi:hypothetical protein